MKKFLSFLLASAMIFNLGSVAFAADTNTKSEFFLNCGDGRYSISSSTRSVLLNNSDIVEAFPTKTEGIFWVNDSLYLVESTETFYTLAEKISLNSFNNDANRAIFDTYDIPEKLQFDIAENIARETQNNNAEFVVDLYVPPLLSSYSGNESSYTYTTDSGHTCKDYIVTYSNCRTDPVEKEGENAKDYADALVNFLISAVGCASKTVGIFGAGKSALDVYIAKFGNVQKGTQRDLTYSLLVYDKKTKDTFWYNPYAECWDEGCLSFFVQMKRNDTYQYYASSGNSDLHQTNLTDQYNSAHYYDPDWAVLNSPICYVDDPIYIELYGTSFRA